MPGIEDWLLKTEKNVPTKLQCYLFQWIYYISLFKLTQKATTFLFCRYQNSPKSPYCFKNISDADKAIEDHALATHASFSDYKPEWECNSKGKYAKR